MRHTRTESMNFLILGSGGCTLIPRPCCHCAICREAREEGIPYARTGPSLFLEDINVLFDTPEEIAYQLNRENIQAVDYIFYTHWHPDHTAGMRIVEQMNMHWSAAYIEGTPPSKKIKICALPQVMRDLGAIRNRFGSYLDYYERLGLVTPVSLEKEMPLRIRNIDLIPIPVEHSEYVSTVFVIKNQGKKVVYAPCDVKPFPVNRLMRNVDVLITGGLIPEGTLKGGYPVPEEDRLRRDFFTMDEILEIIDKFKIARTIVVHIEEEYGKSFDDYRKIEEQYAEYNIQFGYDGMRIEL